MTSPFIWVFVVIWFYHLSIGAAAGAAIYRIYPERKNEFIKYTMIHLHAAVFDAIGAIVCVFLANGVQFTWKFTIAIFASMLVRDLVRLPLVLFILRGPGREIFE